MQKPNLNKNRIQNIRSKNRFTRTNKFQKSRVFQPKRNKNILISSFLLGLVVLTYGAYSITKVKSFDQNSSQYIKNIDSNCKSYKKDSNLSSLVIVRFGDDNSLKSINLLSFNKEKSILFDFTSTTFNIDKGLNKGTFSDYVNKNHLYLDRTKILNNISNLFLREFNIKVNYIISGEETFSLEDFFKSLKTSVFTKLVSPTERNASSQKVYSNICSEYLDTVADAVNLQGIESKKIDYNGKKKLTEYFNFADIKKEQVRVHLNNMSGVEGWGNVIEKIFENYGINVVKVDDGGQTQFKSKVFFETKELQNYKTSNQLLGLLQDPSIDFTIKQNIYADIYIELGEDSLINY